MGISVRLGGKSYGYYEFLTEPFCHNCSSPDVTTENCILNDYIYGIDIIYSLGKYLKFEKDNKSLLSNHIRGLKQKGYKNYGIPLGNALNIFVQEKHSRARSRLCRSNSLS